MEESYGLGDVEVAHDVPLLAENLYRFFHVGDDETQALRGVSLTVAAGEIVSVTGPSGSGKSTLLACLAGLDDPDGGSVTINGVVMSRRPEPLRAALRARCIGMLFQSNNLIEHLNIRDNIRFAQQLIRGVPSTDAKQLLTKLGLGSRQTAFPSQLSGGESARAGLAVALANSPSVLLADEPTGELDSETQSSVMTMLREQAMNGMAVLIVTHSRDVSAQTDREIRLFDGQVAA